MNNEQEPRRLTIDESRQLLTIQQTPEEQRTEEQRAIWDVYTQRDAYERRQKELQRQARQQNDEEARRANFEYRQRLMAADQAESATDSMEYFVRRLSQRQRQQQAIRLADSDEQAFQYLAKAYAHEVSAVGRILQPDERTKQVLQTAARWLTSHNKPGLILRGNVGVGKTTLLYAIRDVLSIRLGHNLVVWDATRIAALGKGADGQKVFEQLCQRPLLGIDDLGTEPITVKDYGNDITPLITLLTERYNQRLATIITTNLAIVERECKQVDEIVERYGERIADRLKELCHTIIYDSNQQSYRQ